MWRCPFEVLDEKKFPWNGYNMGPLNLRMNYNQPKTFLSSRITLMTVPTTTPRCCPRRLNENMCTICSPECTQPRNCSMESNSWWHKVLHRLRSCGWDSRGGTGLLMTVLSSALYEEGPKLCNHLCYMTVVHTLVNNMLFLLQWLRQLGLQLMR